MGILSKILIIVAITFLLLGIAGGIIYTKAKDISSIRLEDSRIQVINATQESFAIEGYLIVNNPSDTSVPFKTINYQITLDATGETMATGEIPASEITQHNITRIEFGQIVTIPPSATQLMQEPNVFATIKAEITLDYPIANRFPIPFEQKIDIKPQIQQMAMLEMINYSLS